jgi:hypothetical protein
MSQHVEAPSRGVLWRIVSVPLDQPKNVLVAFASLAIIAVVCLVGIIVLGCLGRTIPAELGVIASSAAGAIGGAVALAPHVAAHKARQSTRPDGGNDHSSF